jgi:hypothetical protein
MLFGIGVNQLYSSRYHTELMLKKTPQINAFAGFLFLKKGRKTSIHQQLEPILLVTTVPRSNQFWVRSYQTPIPLTLDLSIRYSILKDDGQFESITDWRFGIGATSAGVINLELGMLPKTGLIFGLNFSIPTLNNTLEPGLEAFASFREIYTRSKKSHR